MSNDKLHGQMSARRFLENRGRLISAFSRPHVKKDSWTYSFIRDRLVNGPNGIRLKLEKRVKPELSIRLKNPRVSRVDQYTLVQNESSTRVAIKFAPSSDTRISSEVEAVRKLSEFVGTNDSGILIPDVICVKGTWSEGAGLISPWKENGTLWESVRDETTEIYQLRRLVKACARVLRSLHSIPVSSKDIADNRLSIPESISTVPNAGDKAAQIRVGRVFAQLRNRAVSYGPNISYYWTHGDCFSYQFLRGNEGDQPVWLCDWETLRPSRSGLHDLAQLWASLEIAITLNPRLRAHVEDLWNSFQAGYECRLEESIVFRVLELQALLRFSPRCRKFVDVVPINTSISEQESGKDDLESLFYEYDALVDKKCRGLLALKSNGYVGR